jgi:hypothetical protein
MTKKAKADRAAALALVRDLSAQDFGTLLDGRHYDWLYLAAQERYPDFWEEIYRLASIIIEADEAEALAECEL